MPGFVIGFQRCNSFRCWLCDRYWPYDDQYEWCPCCREQCNGHTKPAMTAKAALSLATEYAFGWWLWDTNSL